MVKTLVISVRLSARTEIEKLNYSINFEQSVCCCGFRFVRTKLEFFKSFIVCLNTLCPDEDSVIIVKSSVFISLCWVNDCYLCDWSLKLDGGRSQFYISHSAIPSWVHVGHSGYGPFTPNSIGILHNHHVIHSDIASFHFLLLSWNQGRKHVSGPVSPKAVYYFLHKFCSVVSIVGFSERSLQYC